MTEQIHGHEVMAMMMASGRTYTRESLRAHIIETFGEDARFYTCSAENMTADELVTFLRDRGKFVEAADGFTTEADKMCGH